MAEGTSHGAEVGLRWWSASAAGVWGLRQQRSTRPTSDDAGGHHRQAAAGIGTFNGTRDSIDRPPTLPNDRQSPGPTPSRHRRTPIRRDLTGRAGHVAVWLARHIKGRNLFAIDLIGIVFAAYLALALRFDQLTGPLAVPELPFVVVLLLAARTVSNIRLGLYDRRWRYASVPELEAIVGAVVLGSLVSIVAFYGTSPLWNRLLRRGRLVGRGVPSLVLVRRDAAQRRDPGRRPIRHPGGIGVQIRSPDCWRAREARDAALRRRAGRRAAWPDRPSGTPARTCSRSGSSTTTRTSPAGPSPGSASSAASRRMDRAVAETGAKVLLITMPGAPGSAVRRVLEAASALDLDVRTVPSVTELLDGSVNANRVRRIRVEDLLKRPMITEHFSGVDAIIRDRTVLITGGGGSIGSELARQVYALGPRRLVLVDRAESPLYLVERDLATRRRRGRGSGEVRVHLANVASRATMERLIADEAPSVIFHAAAYKHVPLMEEHPSDATHVNIGGTLVLLDAALAAGVERFVFVSTDKAVLPSSVMGASKRIAEMLVSDTARRTGRPYVSVRFGNVLGSTGSVVPIFQEQLENGEPITITHPDMTRFFMAIPEAAWLILDAAALGTNGDLFVLDMGEPVRIMDLARDLVRLAGRDPESQPFEIVGLRPGEKLHEELFYDAERVEQTASAKVLKAVAPPPPDDVREHVRRLLSMASGADEPALAGALLDYVRAVDGPRPVVAEVEAAARPADRVQADVSPAPAGHGSRRGDEVTAGEASPFLPFARPSITEREKQAVIDVLDSGWLTTGARAKEFEQRFAEAVGARHAVALNSATAALHLSLEALGVGPDDEVIVPTWTFAASRGGRRVPGCAAGPRRRRPADAQRDAGGDPRGRHAADAGRRRRPRRRTAGRDRAARGGARAARHRGRRGCRARLPEPPRRARPAATPAPSGGRARSRSTRRRRSRPARAGCSSRTTRRSRRGRG